jgi:hypothetical protein
MEIKKKAFVQPIFLLPPFEGFWGQTFTMIGKIEGYDPVHRSHFSVVEEMAPLSTIRAGRVLTDEGNSLPAFFKINSIFHTLNGEPDVLSRSGFYIRHRSAS